MKFTKEFLSEMEGETVYDKITRHSRWSVHHERVFAHEGKFYLTTYSVGATECQEESPYDYTDLEIECAEVRPVTVEVVQYVPVETEAPNAQ